MNKKVKEISITFICVLVALCFFTVFRLIKPSALEEKFVTNTNVNVRSGPGMEYSKIGFLKKGIIVTIIDYENGWYKIDFNDTEGYVFSELISLYKEPEVETKIVESVNTTAYDGEDRELAIAIFDKVNAYRESIGIEKLIWDERLYAVSYTRAVEISTLWSHERPNGLYPDSAFAEHGIKYNLASENLLRYVTNADDSFSTWYNSPTHCATMGSASLRKSAIYVYHAPDGYLYVAQEFID